MHRLLVLRCWTPLSSRLSVKRLVVPGGRGIFENLESWNKKHCFPSFPTGTCVIPLTTRLQCLGRNPSCPGFLVACEVYINEV